MEIKEIFGNLLFNIIEILYYRKMVDIKCPRKQKSQKQSKLGMKDFH